MTTIPFANIPSNLRVPLFYAEVDKSAANTNQQTQRTLLIGQMITGSAGVANVPILSSGPGAGAALGGAGSIIDGMSQAYADNDNFGEVWLLMLADAGGAVAATGTLTFTGPATAAGSLSLYIAGLRVQVPVTVGMTAAQLATAVAAAITAGVGVGPDGATWNLPVTAAAVAAVVTVTAKNAGLAGNDIDLQINFQGVSAGEVTPAGVAVAIVAMANGATNPTLTTALANLGSKAFDFIVTPYSDATSIAAITALLNDTTGRWSWETQVYGHCFGAYRGTPGALTTFGTALNDPHSTFMGFYGSPSPAWAWAAAVAGAAAVSLRADPALPLQTLPLYGVWAPPLASRFSLSQRNTLLYDGISTFNVTSGQVAIENLITTYQLNAQGQPDNSDLEVETLFTTMAVLRALAGTVTSTLARKKLAANGSPAGSNSNIVTPNIIRGLLIAQYSQLQIQGLVQDAGYFAANLVVQQNATNPNRVDVFFPPVLIDQLRIFAVLFQFRLIAPAGSTAANGQPSGALV